MFTSFSLTTPPKPHPCTTWYCSPSENTAGTPHRVSDISRKSGVTGLEAFALASLGLSQHLLDTVFQNASLMLV